MEIRDRVEGYRDELLRRLGKLVSINSAEGTPLPDAPFGEGPKNALQTALQMLQEDGFKTVNLDNYAGYAEMGQGDQLIGVIGHLDVVPAAKEDGWDTDPFTMVEKDGNVYGRGVSDDKGGVVASMIALKVLRDMGYPVNKRIRLIMGTNEETGSRGLAYYVAHEGHVDLGFTPDGDFPAINGEKGMISAVYRSKSTNLIDVHGGSAKNIVCAKVWGTVRKNCFSQKALSDYFNNVGIGFEVTDNDNGTVTIFVQGKAAHASMPELGTNAISYLFCGLKAAGFQDPFTDFYVSHFGLETNGKLLGIALSDDYGALTLNNGIISMKDGVVEGSVDIRFPVTMNSKQVLREMNDHLEDDNGVIEILSTTEPLYFSPDSPLVSALAGAYEEVTGDHEHKPLCIGGGTYAKGIHNTIAFGCAFPGVNYRIHDTNEWCPIDDLLKQAEIYVVGLQRLLEI